MFMLQLLIILSLLSATTCLAVCVDMLRTANALGREIASSPQSF